MDDLSYGLKKLCLKNRDGSFNTQADRQDGLLLIARQLQELGFRHMKLGSLKFKHVQALVASWQGQGLSEGTIKNRLAYVRWWADKVGRNSAVPAENQRLGVGNRVYVTNEDKSLVLDGRLYQIRDDYVRLSLELQQLFGLRREEAIKFNVAYADRDDRIVLKDSWTKGGRARVIPITTVEQRQLLNRIRVVAGDGALIAPGRNFIQQRDKYDNEVKRVGLSKPHGLRHGYAQKRFAALAGRAAPATGGPRREDLLSGERGQDNQVRQIVSEELGHGRIDVTAIYLGS